MSPPDWPRRRNNSSGGVVEIQIFFYDYHPDCEYHRNATSQDKEALPKTERIGSPKRRTILPLLR